MQIKYSVQHTVHAIVGLFASCVAARVWVTGVVVVVVFTDDYDDDDHDDVDDDDDGVS